MSSHQESAGPPPGMEKSKSKLKIWLENQYRNGRYSMDMAKIMRQCESWCDRHFLAFLFIFSEIMRFS
ncbi:expressed protein [Arabidopsis lyrata subsp. lyrata]|uniref:Expressed protein n=1 Tax=Arabidopsis lyrata subsp. lyrata TaxID=81972 RepID=D7MK03_ARALL|nr:expressed protein [Arabidopsis lyrata subsp. lyrata]